MAEWAVVLVPFIRSCLDTNMFNSILIRVKITIFYNCVLDIKINVTEIELAKEEKREPKIFELFTCHTLRHTYATRCYENGVDQQVVQKLLGHSILAMTTDLYTHVSEEKKKEEVAELKILA